jgi:two-component system response regulator YesN
MKSIIVMDCEEQGSFWMTLKCGYPIHFSTTAEEGLEMLSENVGLVFINQKLADMDGMEVLRLLKKSYPWVPVVMITFCGTVDTCVEAFREGARDYIRRPLNAEEIVEKINILMYTCDLSYRREHISLSTESIRKKITGVGHYSDIPFHLLNGVLKVRDFIAQNYSESLTLADACKMASVKKTYFCRIFKRITGHTLRSYHHAIKVRIAEELLRDQRLPVGNVAKQLGYSDSNYFSTIFKKITGVSPRQYCASGHDSHSDAA